MSSSSTVSINVAPVGASQTCTVAKDVVTITTSSSTGYTLTLIDNDASNTMVSGGNSISATAGNYASPATIGTNKWGYRVDGRGSFGAGPTLAQTNGSVPTDTYAAVQPSTGAADTIMTSSSAATSGAITNVWYALCLNTTIPSGTYSDNVLYTATIN